jgi:hypothetical protein
MRVEYSFSIDAHQRVSVRAVRADFGMTERVVAM